MRWSWRLLRREWRQQLLILALVTVAVAATIVGASVAMNTPPPTTAGFGNARDAASYGGSDAHLGAQLATLERRFGRIDVIENETLEVPGSTSTYDLRAQNPHGAFGAPMLALVSGRYPRATNEVALSAGVAADFHVGVGGIWHGGGVARTVVGIVEDPLDLLDRFALVLPGQVRAPTQVTALFDAHGVSPSSIGPNVTTPTSASNGSALNPETISRRPAAGMDRCPDRRRRHSDAGEVRRSFAPGGRRVRAPSGGNHRQHARQQAAALVRVKPLS